MATEAEVVSEVVLEVAEGEEVAEVGITMKEEKEVIMIEEAEEKMAEK